MISKPRKLRKKVDTDLDILCDLFADIIIDSFLLSRQQKCQTTGSRIVKKINLDRFEVK